MPGTLTHTRITWALSPTAPQIPGVTAGSPLCPWCFGHSIWRGAQQWFPNMVWVLLMLLWQHDDQIKIGLS